MHLPTLSSAATYFTNSYPLARDHWLKRAGALVDFAPQSEQGSLALNLLGPEGETLATDWLWLGAPDADNVVLLFSATHGIEGYVGNAVQCFWSDCLLSQTLLFVKNTALLFVHGLNPWGMAYLRRCDENGVDLNRNYIDFQQPPVNADYIAVQSCLAIDDPGQRQQALQHLANELGQIQYQIALSGGQFIDPDGPYYGGREPAHGHRVSRQLAEQFNLAGRCLVVLDIHSGLGAWSHGELISDHPLNNANDCYAQKLFGPAVTNPARGDSSSVAKYGLQDYFWHALMNDRGCYLTLEYGTYPTPDLFQVLIADHRLWKQGANSATLAKNLARQQQAMYRHFCPADRYWRQLVLIQAAQILDRLLTGLSPAND